MTEKGGKCLESLLREGFSDMISYVVVGRDKNILRDYSDEIQCLCSEYGIQCFEKNDPILLNADFFISISWRWMIDAGNRKLIVFHDSLLPKYRGFAPLVNALINGEKEVGVSAIWGEKHYDEGPILIQKKYRVCYPIKINNLIKEVISLYIQIVLEVFKSMRSGLTLIEKTQVQEDATYSLWLDDDDYWVDWTLSATEIQRFVDSVGFPYLGARTLMNGTAILLDDVEVLEDVVIENRHIGKIIRMEDGLPVVVCGNGLLKITHARYLSDSETSVSFKRFRSRFTRPCKTL